MEYKIERLESMIQTELGKVFTRELELPKNTLLSISRVLIHPDFKTGIVFLSIFPKDKENEHKVLRVLNAHWAEMNKMIAPKIKFRSYPSLRYEIDEQLIKQNRVDEILDAIQKGE